MYYVIGLGNPGAKYAHTRHNIGREIVAQFAEVEQCNEWTRDKAANAYLAQCAVHDASVTLVLPETYMNRSGETVRYLRMEPSEMIVVYDDIDLPLGKIKISKGKGDGGHNGMKSILGAVATNDIIRIRVGVAPTSFWTGDVKRPAGGAALERFVLSRFKLAERRARDRVAEQVFHAITTIVADGVDIAMNQFN